MTALLSIDKLSEARHFPFRDVRPEMIRAVPIGPTEAVYWAEVVPLLAERGRKDLVSAIEKKLADARREERWHSNAGWKGRLRVFDRRVLGGRLADLRRRLSAGSRTG